MPSVEEIREHQARRQPPVREIPTAVLEAQRAAAEKLARLIQADEWETFRLIVDGFIEDARARLEVAHEAIEAGIQGDALTVAAREAHGLRREIATYDRVLAVPKEVIAHVERTEAAG